VLLAGINLTIVCQGHDHGGHHTGVHLAIAPEPHQEGEESVETHAVTSTMPEAPRVLGKNTPSVSLGTPTESSSLGALALVLFVPGLLGAAGRLARGAAGIPFRKSQTVAGPDPPPPRNSSSAN
jgi:hypothetical protein